MPHHKIVLPEPLHLPSDQQPALWHPRGVMVQWGSYGGPTDGPSVGVGSGIFADAADDDEFDAIVAKSGVPAHQFMMIEWLNRSQINELITTLRRARDGAYGKDA